VYYALHFILHVDDQTGNALHPQVVAVGMLIPIGERPRVDTLGGEFKQALDRRAGIVGM
jgi:hypothetical protein